ncbi:hypothetical protein ACS0TY_035448 [Phlomoides rotata]
MEGEVDMAVAVAEDGAIVELDDMKKRLKEMEDEAAALREMQTKVEQEMGDVQDPSVAAANQTNMEEVDARSIFVGNVDYACISQEDQCSSHKAILTSASQSPYGLSI